MKRWLAQRSSGRRVTLLPVTIFLHTGPGLGGGGALKRNLGRAVPPRPSDL